MIHKIEQKQEWAVASYALHDAYTDFILSRQAMLCSPQTIRFYHFTAGKFVQYLEESGITTPSETSARHIRAYLSLLTERSLSDSYIHGHARAIRTLVRFWNSEKYIPDLISFEMPKVAKKRLLVLSIEDIQKALSATNKLRDKALILLMVDTGLRRAEVCSLTWGDVNIASGLIQVVRGKGGKARSVVIGVRTRRVLLAYRREVEHSVTDPLIQTKQGNRLSHSGLRSALLRIGQRANIHITPHALRRTFATLSLKAGMNLIQLQAILGHSSLEMTRQYIQLLDEDLLEAHQHHGPVDSFFK